MVTKTGEWGCKLEMPPFIDSGIEPCNQSSTCVDLYIAHRGRATCERSSTLIACSLATSGRTMCTPCGSRYTSTSNMAATSAVAKHAHVMYQCALKYIQIYTKNIYGQVGVCWGKGSGCHTSHSRLAVGQVAHCHSRLDMYGTIKACSACIVSSIKSRVLAAIVRHPKDPLTHTRRTGCRLRRSLPQWQWHTRPT